MNSTATKAWGTAPYRSAQAKEVIDTCLTVPFFGLS